MRLNLLSIDIEDWYLSYDSSQISSNKWSMLESRVEAHTRLFLQLLADNKQKASFFVLGWIAERHPALIRQIAAAGHEIGYHSYMHQLPVKQGKVQFEADLVRGLDLLESITGQRPVQYRAPMFSLCRQSGWAIPILLKHGIHISSSYKSHQKINEYKVPPVPFYIRHQGQQLLELPLNRLGIPHFNFVYTGSGYFRLLPKWAIQYLFSRSNYNMAYFHPRDFDVQVPATRLLPAYRNLMNRLGNDSTAGKLQSLLTATGFHSLGEAAVLLEKEDLQVLHL